MPIFCVLFCIFTMANIALPLTANFVGEFLIFQGAFCNNTLVTFLGATSMIFSGGYSLLAYGRVAYGACKPHFIRRCAVKAIISSLGNPLGAHSESWAHFITSKQFLGRGPFARPRAPTTSKPVEGSPRVHAARALHNCAAKDKRLACIGRT